MQADLLSEPPGKPKNTGVGSLSFLQEIFLTQELNWGLLHCRPILYQLSYQGSPHANKDSWKYLPVQDSSLPSVQFSRSVVSDSATPWTAARQASLSITNSQSWPKLMSIESVILSTISLSVIPFSSCFQSFPESGSFLVSQLFSTGGQSIGASASAPVLPMNLQGWLPLGLTGLISLLSKGLSRVFSSWPFYSWPLNNKGLGHLLPTQLKIHT